MEIRVGNHTVAARVDGNTVQIGDTGFRVEAIGDGLYRVSDGATNWLVAVAGPPEDRWVWIDGRVVEVEIDRGSPSRRRTRSSTHDLASPMPATVLRVLVEPGARVAKGEPLLILEAMKMELPIRAPRDGLVRALHCRPGELVQPGVNLLDFE